MTDRYTRIWQQLPQKGISQTLGVILVVYIAYMLAKGTWLFFPDPEIVAIQGSSTGSSQANSASFDTTEFKKLNLFGVKTEKQENTDVTQQQEESAPETRLNLTLTGLVASDDARVAAAIIESQGKQETYGIDDKIEGTRAILKRVKIDRVIIESAGRLETLMLDGFEYTNKIPSATGQPNPKPATTTSATRRTLTNNQTQVNQAKIKERVAQLKADIKDNPAKFTDYIKITPHRERGQIKGYRLSPGKDREFFSDVGLKPGDIALEINGNDLTDIRQAQQALKELRQSTQLSLVVKRGGEIHDISLDLEN
ncbi:type II secretion system protein GspC [Thalassotalea sp. PS06]|uniref:type II secretion system protein GspC n=1 Tax=Thalassotalea sp. PS06 TaxID=2594005 RepID=UPI00163D8401|nr:type II secretion system protein GspC [Thalassotalea sp. PS06]